MEILKTKSFRLAANIRGNKSSEKLALVLPGRLDTKDYQCFTSHIELLSKKGFYAICFDPPGTWESPGGVELFTTTNYIKAVNEMINSFGNKPTLLLGHSRGGATAIHAGAKNPAVFAITTVNASLGAPTPPGKEELKNGKYVDTRDLPPGTKRTEKRKKFIAPLTYFTDGAKYDDSKVIKTCTKPKLMFYSKEDEFNTNKYVKSVFEKIPKPKEICEIPGTHDYRLYPKAVKKVEKTMVEFLDRYMP